MKEVDPRRRTRLELYVRENLTLAEISDREGMERTNLSRLRTQIAKELGLPKPTSKGGRPYPIAYGTTQDSKAFRYLLGGYLLDVRNKHGAVEAAALTGVPVRQQQSAIDKPYRHDWRISQIERLARAVGLTFEQMMDEIDWKINDIA